MEAHADPAPMVIIQYVVSKGDLVFYLACRHHRKATQELTLLPILPVTLLIIMSPMGQITHITPPLVRDQSVGTCIQAEKMDRLEVTTYVTLT